MVDGWMVDESLVSKEHIDFFADAQTELRCTSIGD